MKKTNVILLMFLLIVCSAPLRLSAQEKSTSSSTCVVLSMWSCKDCTDAQCYQFTNNCTYKVKVTWKSKLPDGKWMSGDIYLDPGETSPETFWCPYIQVTWSYVKA